MRRRTIAAALALAATLAACSEGGGSVLAVTPSPPAATSGGAGVVSVPSPTRSSPRAAPDGTRFAPLALGEARKISHSSAWTVSLVSRDVGDARTDGRAPADGEKFVSARFTVTVDASALPGQGIDIANDGVDPAASLTFTYVTAAGSPYDSSQGTGCPTDSPFSSLGSLHADGATAVGDVCVAVPADEAAGGVWRVSNSANEAVWFAGS